MRLRGIKRVRWTWAFRGEEGIVLGLGRAAVIRVCGVGRERRGQHGRGFSQQHFDRAIDSSETTLSDGDDLGEEEGGGRKEKRMGDRRGCQGNVQRLQRFGGDW